MSLSSNSAQCANHACSAALERGPGLWVSVRHLSVAGRGGIDQEVAGASRPLVQSLALHIPPGTIHTLMGPSGCGKSSVLGAIAGTVSPQGPGVCGEWTVSLDGRCLDALPTERRGIGLLFQDDLLFAHMTVAQNLLFAVPPGPKAQRLAEVERALQEADLVGLGARDPATLSGGQRSRVALMRALLARPRALLLDEPFSKLDAQLRGVFRAWVFEHVRQRGVAALLVTHDEADVADPKRLTRLGGLLWGESHA